MRVPKANELSAYLVPVAEKLQLAEGTIATYQRHWNRLGRFCARQPIELDGFTPELVQIAYDELTGHHSASHHLSVKAALKFAFEQVRLPNPFARCRGPKFQPAHAAIKYLEPEAVHQLFAVLRDWVEPKPLPANAELPRSFEAAYFARLALVICSSLYHTGTRFAEWAKLPRSKISWSGGWPVRVEVCGKGKKYRTIDLSEPIAAELKEWLVALDGFRGDRMRLQNLGFAGSELIFPGRAGEPISNQFLNKYLRAACRAARVNVITSHGLRHSVATAVLRDPANNLRHVQELLGHAQISTTARYTHVASRELRGVLDRIGKAGPNSPEALKITPTSAGTEP